MRRQVLQVMTIAAALGAAPVALAEGGGGGSGTSSSSPGVSEHNDSMTGVAIPGTAPVDSRTHQPAQIGTGSVSKSATRHGEGTGAGSPAYTDLTQENSASGSSTSSEKAQ